MRNKSVKVFKKLLIEYSGIVEGDSIKHKVPGVGVIYARRDF